VAFAVGSLHEYWIDISSASRVEISIDLSEEFLFFMSKRRDGLGHSGGTTLAAAKSALAADGHCLEALYPYQMQVGPSAAPSSRAITDGKQRKLDILSQLKTEEAVLEESLRKGLPVVGVVELFRGAFRPLHGGELPLPSSGERPIGKHAILLVGSERSSHRTNFVFLNSWGASWGDGGFGRLNSEYFARYCSQLWSIEKSGRN